MQDHKLSKNVCCEKICSVVQYFMMSKTDVTLLIYMMIFRRGLLNEWGNFTAYWILV